MKLRSPEKVDGAKAEHLQTSSARFTKYQALYIRMNCNTHDRVDILTLCINKTKNHGTPKNDRRRIWRDYR